MSADSGNKTVFEVIEKPESVSYRQIQDLLSRAHEDNEAKGLHYATTKQSEQRLMEKIGKEGVCFVAVNDKTIAGTGSIGILNISHWYFHGRAAHLQLIGVDPAYRGHHLGSLILEKLIEKAGDMGFETAVMTSAEENTAIKKLALKYGFKMVNYDTYRNNNFYSVVYMKWLDHCPFNDGYINMRYNLKRLYTRMRYRPGRTQKIR